MIVGRGGRVSGLRWVFGRFLVKGSWVFRVRGGVLDCGLKDREVWVNVLWALRLVLYWSVSLMFCSRRCLSRSDRRGCGWRWWWGT